VSYSAPDPLAGTEGPLHVDGKERKKEEKKRKTERIGRKEENSIKKISCYGLALNFQNKSLNVIEFGALSNMGVAACWR